MEPIAITIADTVKVLGLGKTKIYELMKVGQLTYFKVGRRTLIRFDSIRALSNCNASGA